jgi:DNA-binding XRE family transcriptional regulator
MQPKHEPIKEKTRGKSAPANGSAAEDPALLTRKQLAKKISLSTRSVDSLQKRKVIPVIRLSPRCCRFSLEAVLRALGRFEVKEATR